MNALTALRTFIAINKDAENVIEIREYIAEHLVELARNLGVSTETVTKTLASVEDDAVLATKVLAAIKKAEASRRDLKKEGRTRAAQAAADKLASLATWVGERVQLDVAALLSSALTKRNDLIVFTCEDFSVAVPQAILLDLARLRRRDLTGFVDAEGLHVRWRTGGLNLRPQLDAHADRIVLRLSLKKAEAA